MKTLLKTTQMYNVNNSLHAAVLANNSLYAVSFEAPIFRGEQDQLNGYDCTKHEYNKNINS